MKHIVHTNGLRWRCRLFTWPSQSILFLYCFPHNLQEKGDLACMSCWSTQASKNSASPVCSRATKAAHRRHSNISLLKSSSQVSSWQEEEESSLSVEALPKKKKIPPSNPLFIFTNTKLLLRVKLQCQPGLIVYFMKHQCVSSKRLAIRKRLATIFADIWALVKVFRVQMPHKVISKEKRLLTVRANMSLFHRVQRVLWASKKLGSMSCPIWIFTTERMVLLKNCNNTKILQHLSKYTENCNTTIMSDYQFSIMQNTHVLLKLEEHLGTQ